MNSRGGPLVQNILSRCHGVNPSSSGWMARCPAHEDENPSLSIREGTDGKILLKCFAGCTLEQICSALGIKQSDLFPDSGRSKRQIVATFDYFDRNKNLLFQVVKFLPKDFRQRRPDGSGGWAWNLKGVNRVLYRLPDLVSPDRPAEETVFVVEGEKDADRLAGLGLLATTNPMGAGKWSKVDQEPLRGRNVVILPDNDAPGLEHSQDVASRLQAVAEVVKILEFSDLPEHGDVSDWLDQGGTADRLLELADAAPEWTPKRLQVHSEADESGRILQGKQQKASSEATSVKPCTETGRGKGSELWIGHRIIKDHGEDLKWIGLRRKWFIWSGRRWKPASHWDSCRAPLRRRSIRICVPSTMPCMI